MKTFQLTAEPRTDLGKKAAKAIRKENKNPRSAQWWRNHQPSL